MSDSVWMRDPEGVYASVAKDQVDTWKPRGLTEVDEPTDDTTFVHMTHDDVEGRARIPWGARDYWQARGFRPTEPPEPVDVTKDPVLVDVVEDKPAKKAAPKKKAAADDTEQAS
jgi:hypothetical protein